MLRFFFCLNTAKFFPSIILIMGIAYHGQRVNLFHYHS